MSQCPGCGQSYCLSCEKSIDPRLYRCEPECRQEHDEQDPFAIAAEENHIAAIKWERAAMAARACLEYMSGEQRDKELGDLIAHEYNEAWNDANECKERIRL